MINDSVTAGLSNRNDIDYMSDIDMMRNIGKNSVKTERKSDNIRIIKPKMSASVHRPYEYYKQLNSFSSDFILSRFIF